MAGRNPPAAARRGARGSSLPARDEADRHSSRLAGRSNTPIMQNHSILALFCSLRRIAFGLVLANALPAQPPTPASKLPITEVTVFKDGHSFVVRRGRAAVDARGHAVLEELPQPLMGTLWPFAAGGARLAAVVAGKRVEPTRRPAVGVRALIEANVGAEVIVNDNGERYAARIEAIPRGPATRTEPSQPGEIVLLRTADGVRVARIDQIRQLTFRGDYEATEAVEEVRGRLELRLDWDGAPAAEAEVGMAYVQKGLRWIPSYRVELGDDGKARVALQATLVNELADLEDATANLVIGVPQFRFADTLDPMALQETAAALSSHFRQDSQTAYAFSNAIMTQQPSTVQRAAAAEDTTSLATDSAAEDLFVFTVDGVTLREGERMVVPLTSFEIPYRDVYRLDVPITPPPQVWQQLDQRRLSNLVALQHAPKAMHAVRLHNTSAAPLTTAPALLLGADGRVLAQSMMTYTPIGGRSDLTITTAVNIAVAKHEGETKRTAREKRFADHDYLRIDVHGRLVLTSHSSEPVTVEVRRHVLGYADRASGDGAISARHVFETPPGETGAASWWRGYPWPWWWHHVNGIARIDWDVELQPGAQVELDYDFHYYWY